MCLDDFVELLIAFASKVNLSMQSPGKSKVSILSSTAKEKHLNELDISLQLCHPLLRPLTFPLHSLLSSLKPCLILLHTRLPLAVRHARLLVHRRHFLLRRKKLILRVGETAFGVSGTGLEGFDFRGLGQGRSTQRRELSGEFGVGGLD